MGNAEAGWYDDGRGLQRWWDGAKWTEHYADMSGSRVELHADAPVATRADSAAVASTIAVMPGWYDDKRGRIRWWDGHHWSSKTQFSPTAHSFAGITVDGGWIHYLDASQPTADVIATYETAGAILERSTFTRATAGGLVLGPPGMNTGALFKKKVDRREFYLAIDGADQYWIVAVPPALGTQARQFVAWVNTVSRQHFSGR
ncbi:hypothetical protein ASD65_01965 [Microbacterium sp. Root61]|uniref:DUF2510 domain-containing protein n=1 Tax=Microbacterium sp. Root61 TaxID=1736570 RepID=UPI0006F768B3|nr:DUF2510 domain-containing protein [Microbacterium sp. Root61]KRA23320.1 hypothetical protein ASD65_01965 [Microbacterium sp. Root61]